MWPLATDLPFDGIHLVDRPWFPYLCTEVEHWEWETNGEAHYNFWVCLGGEGTLQASGQSYRIKPGMFFIFSPNQRVSAAHYFGERITRFSAHFIPLSGAVVLDAVPGFPVLGGEIRDLARLKRQIEMIMRLAFRRGDEILLHRHMYELIANACSQEEAQAVVIDERVSKAMQVMRSDPAGVESMESLARALNWSRSHFDREFSRQVGQAPKQFLLNCKMIEARRLLESSRLRVGEIAERLGYRDIYFFSRQFKAFYSRSPANYRKSLSGVLT
ncbi:helix-turn-helix domain-containing protein [Coraliomargarita akajimensis]|uniref:Transcriptional regulator, AraC family n=1 Tax=Coraliomargarita akajimensis (strain DSM 45221 / IAM 15411 / JCM 23193 / KCTC 12865 / 04OKA010-24) TaxID=583355 RepID=D5EQR1_CORAD|nr:AraC family transcriptional regulator [Coraliomargarita akajimensis]ADE55875.1 transcriptional regulator, AraC family [Coraliomargarita akajimensis DSM 45221]